MIRSPLVSLLAVVGLLASVAPADGAPSLSATVERIAPLTRGTAFVPSVRITNVSSHVFSGVTDGCVLTYTVTNRAGEIVLDARSRACQSIRLPLHVAAQAASHLELPATVGEIPTQHLPAGQYALNLTVRTTGTLGQRRITRINATPALFTVR